MKMNSERSPEESEARSQCRAIARRHRARVDTRDSKIAIRITPCEIWPEGIVTAFHGWVDLLQRLKRCERSPDLVIEGVYVESDWADNSEFALGGQRR